MALKPLCRPYEKTCTSTRYLRYMYHVTVIAGVKLMSEPRTWHNDGPRPHSAGACCSHVRTAAQEAGLRVALTLDD